MTWYFLVLQPLFIEVAEREDTKNPPHTAKEVLSLWTLRIHVENPNLPPPPLLIATSAKETLTVHSPWCLYPIPGKDKTTGRDHPAVIKTWSRFYAGEREVPPLIKVCQILKEEFCTPDFVFFQHRLSDLWTQLIQDASKTLKNPEEERKTTN